MKPRQSIAKRIQNYMALLVVLVTIGAIGLYASQQWGQQTYGTDITNSQQKANLASTIQQSMNGSVTELRGYMAMKLPQFLDNLRTDRQQLDQAKKQFRALPGLTDDDLSYLDSVDKSENQFFTDNVPVAVKLTDEGNTKELIRVGTQENYIKVTDDFRKANIAYVTNMNAAITQMRADYDTQQSRLFLGFSIYLLIIAVVVGIFATRFGRDVGRPLQEMAQASREKENDLILSLPYHEREDEIGYLTQSLKAMLARIRQNERRMIENNEELQAQQEELISQQDELYHTLMKMQENELVLEAQNRLNTSLVNTLDREELLYNIIKNLQEIQQADKGAIVLLEKGYPHASVGIKPELMKRYLDTLEEGRLTRLEQERKIFVIAREAKPADQGYHEETFTIHDLYVPIFSHKAEIVAVVVLTRLGRAFHTDDIAQAQALANQLSLSIERLHTYHALERDRRLNQEILDSIREGIQLFDRQGRLVAANRTWCNWMNCAPPVNLDATEWLLALEQHVEHPLELIDFIQRTVSGQIPVGEKMMYELRGAEKKIVQVYFEETSEAHGVSGLTVLVHRDITREFEVDQMKSEFVSTVSHELRTPLSSVLGFTELMLNRELKPERQQKYLQTIHREAKRLTELINDFLDIQRMESGKQSYEVSEFNLVAMTDELIESFSMQVDKHQFRVESDAPYVVHQGDEAKIRQVFTNLIGNAVKYSPEGGEVVVRIRHTAQEIAVDVCDQGLGIPREAIGSLFNKFYRIDNSDRRKIGGTGLGLAICKEIMKAHGGTITVESILGRGSVFTVHFPLVPLVMAVAESQAAQGLVAAGRVELQEDRPRLLIIEDDNSLAMLLQDELKENGFLVAHVADGGTAIRLVQEQLPDAIVLDIMLKDSISGWDVIEELKKNDTTSDIPIFISSALEEKERGLALGANHFLTKPYRPSKLSNLILQTLLRKEKNGVIMVPEKELDGQE